MKISKLFHWLYATLMFLPILMFLPSCLYFAFNEHATNETTTEINYKYQSNEVNTLSDLIEDNIYYFNNVLSLDINEELSGMNFTISVYKGSVEFELIDTNIMTWEFYDEKVPLTFIVQNNNLIWRYFTDYEVTYFSLEDIIISIDDNLSNFLNYAYNSNLTNFEYTDYNVIESVTTNVEQTIPQQINNAWNSVWNLSVFSWTQNSFISAPFTYITGLFGVQANNTLNYVFTYFCSISICWLVFDLLMYVPNLAHRWLDKGAIE